MTDYPERIHVRLSSAYGALEVVGPDQTDAREYALVPEAATLDVDWSELPDNAVAVARDEDGEVYWYSFEPVTERDMWLNGWVDGCIPEHGFIRRDPPDPNWRNTLTRRPAIYRDGTG